jgi:cytosine/uracil/thiamine/allantoin permease
LGPSLVLLVNYQTDEYYEASKQSTYPQNGAKTSISEWIILTLQCVRCVAAGRVMIGDVVRPCKSSRMRAMPAVILLILYIMGSAMQTCDSSCYIIIYALSSLLAECLDLIN